MTATRLLGGRYRLLERLGEGGTSVVWRAYDEVLGRPVAVKLLTARFVAQAGSRDRVRTEAQAAATLSHPHITSVHDYGEAPAGTGAAYVVMELLSGPTLADRLRAGPLPVRTALQVGAQVASALAAAHGSGLVHRDVKPGNVILTPAGAKVLDFGLAAAAGTPDESMSDGQVWGTPAYLAPERLTAGEVVPASDVYALGLLLYASLTGHQPWPARTLDELLDAHRFQPPAPLPEIDGLPPEVAALCLQCLAKDPRDRPPAHAAARVLAEAVGWRVAGAVTPWSGTLPDRLATGYARRRGNPTPAGLVRPPVPAAVGADRRLAAVGAPEPATVGAPGPVARDGAGTGGTGPVPADPGRLPGLHRHRNAGRWRGLAMAGSLAVVLGSASGGLWVAGGGDPPRSALPGPGAAGLGAAVGTPTTATDPAAAAGGGSVTGGGAADPGVARDGPTPGGPGQPPGPGTVPADPTGSGSSSGPSSGNDGTGPASPAPAPAPTGAPPTGMAPPDGTDSGAGSPTAPAPPAPVEQTWLTGGGTVTAACDGGSASLVSWAPLPDYTADQVEPGPANEVRIVLSGPESRVEVTIHCESGAPVAEIVAS